VPALDTEGVPASPCARAHHAALQRLLGAHVPCGRSSKRTARAGQFSQGDRANAQQGHSNSLNEIEQAHSRDRATCSLPHLLLCCQLSVEHVPSTLRIRSRNASLSWVTWSTVLAVAFRVLRTVVISTCSLSHSFCLAASSSRSLQKQWVAVEQRHTDCAGFHLMERTCWCEAAQDLCTCQAARAPQSLAVLPDHGAAGH
jgi:hypothetical protein